MHVGGGTISPRWSIIIPCTRLAWGLDSCILSLLLSDPPLLLSATVQIFPPVYHHLILSRTLMSSVKVAVRVRPLNKRELQKNARNAIQISPPNQIVAIRPLDSSSEATLKSDFIGLDNRFKMDAEKRFTFDHTYWSIPDDSATSTPLESPNFASQLQIYQDLGMELLQHAFQGYNATIMAYGQTGSGKSYTM